ncbi:MAG: Flp family type IVb pilin [Actinomycetota bacterium]
MDVFGMVRAAYERVARQWSRRQDGAALVEYALLIAFIAVICLAAVAYIGGWADDTLTSIGDQIQ